MKILVLATKYFGVGGAEALTRAYAEALSAEGADVDVLSFLDGELADRTSPATYLGHSGAQSSAPTQARFVAAALRRGRAYDLVICSHVSVSPVARILHRLFRIRYMVLAHGIEVWGELGPRRLEALRGADRVPSVSKFTARRLVAEQRVAEDRVKVVYPAVDPGLLRRVPAEDVAHRVDAPLRLLTVARLSAQERYKGCDAVIAALPHVAARIGRVGYAIVGDGDDRPRLEALARDRGVSEIVEFVGRVAPDGLAAQYLACDVFVMPSTAVLRPDDPKGEGFGIVYLEAAAFRRPVVAGAGGGAPEAVRDGITGIVVDGHDERAVSAALVRLGEDPTLRSRMGAAGRAWVLDGFTFDRFKRDVAALVEGARVARA
jgi:phosphatidylinositol alpha-1,6-mannosyltransferase